MFTFNAIQMGCCDLTGEVGVCFLKALKYKELAGMESLATMLMAPEVDFATSQEHHKVAGGVYKSRGSRSPAPGAN